MPSRPKLRRLGGRERRLLLATLGRLVWVRLGLWLAPVPTLRRYSREAEAANPAAPPAQRPSPDEVAWSVDAASRYIPGATCLCQALAARAVLNRLGYPTTLRLGVLKATDGRLTAHAWLESQGRVVVGQRGDLAAYTVLPPLAGQR